MKRLLTGVCALIFASACSGGGNADEVLEAMNFADGQAGEIEFASQKASGDKVVLKGVTIGDNGDGIQVESLTLDGLTLSETGEPSFSSLILENIQPQPEGDGERPTVSGADARRGLMGAVGSLATGRVTRETVNMLRQDIPGLHLKVDKVAFEGMNEVTGRYMAGIFADEGPTDPPPFEEWEMGSATLEGFTITMDLEEMGEGPGSFNFEIEEIAVSDLKDMIVGELVWGGISGKFDVPEEASGFDVAGDFNFGDLKITNYRAEPVVQSFLLGMEGADPDEVVEMQTEAMASMTSPLDPGFDSMDWSGMSANGAGVSFAVSPMKFRTKTDRDGVVTEATSDKTTISVDIDPNGGYFGEMVSGFLAPTGFGNHLEFYVESDSSYDPDTNVMSLETYNFGMVDAVDVDLTMDIEGVLEGVSLLMTSMVGGYGMQPTSADPTAIALHGMELTIEDDSLVEKFLNTVGAFTGQSPEALRAEMIAEASSLSEDLTYSGLDADVADELAMAIISFIADPGVLTIKLDPQAPLNADSLGAGLETGFSKSLLGFSADHTPN